MGVRVLPGFMLCECAQMSPFGQESVSYVCVCV